LKSNNKGFACKITQKNYSIIYKLKKEKMKKLIIIAVLAAVTMSAYSAPKVTDYVVTEDGITYFQKVRYGLNAYLVAVKEDGTIVKYTKDEIVSYRKNGEVFKKNTIIKNGQPCEDCEFMKLVKTRHGASLYTYKCIDETGNIALKCMVYKEDKFVLEVTEENFRQVIDFFNKVYN
jgi:hypothetical protein